MNLMLYGSLGVVRHHTIPYTPQYNGVVERMNRTKIEKVLSMLSNVGLSKLQLLWVKATSIACF